MLNLLLDRDSKFCTDFMGESRRDLVSKLAYAHWLARGSPLGSPDTDWFAAEKALYDYLVTAGVCPLASGQRLDQLLYR